MKKTKLINWIASLVFVLLMIIVIPLSIPRLFGFSIYSVLSDSMQPTIPAGSIIYVQSVEIQGLQQADIISFHGQGNNVITHRIIMIEDNLITTKGDHNEDIDLKKTITSNVIGKVMYSLPYYGYIYQSLTNIGGMTGLLFVLMIIMLLWFYSYSKENKNK